MHSIFLVLFVISSSLGIYDNIGFESAGLALYHEGKSYVISTEECPGGIFLTKKVTESCLCYNGMFAVVRDCCTPKNETGVIKTDTFEWRQSFQCGQSPEIGDPGGNHIKAVLPLTKFSAPFRPVLTFTEFGGREFVKWRKFDVHKLSLQPKPVSFKGILSVDILNVMPLHKELKFSFGENGDIDICYEGWRVKHPQTLRISVYTNSKIPKDASGPCCFKVTTNNSPGIITSPCRSGAIIAATADVESLNSGMSCRLRLDTSARRVKRSDDEEDDPDALRYSLHELLTDPIDEQNRKLKIFQIVRKTGVNKDLNLEPGTQRMMLLKQSVKIFQSKIKNDMVPTSMTDDAFEAFFFLYESLDSQTELDEQDFNKIKANLDKCVTAELPVSVFADACPPTFGKMTVSVNDSTLEVPIPNPPSQIAYDRKRFDIVIDINWKVVDFVQSICVEHFVDDFTSHHLYGEQMRSIFLHPIVQKRWYRKIDLTDVYAQGIISNFDREIRMKDVDKAVAMAHSPYFTNFIEWIPRPVLKSLPSQDPNFISVKPYEHSQVFDMIADGRISMSATPDFDEEVPSQDTQYAEDETDYDLQGGPVERKKKHVRTNLHRSKSASPRHNTKSIKPGDKIWDGLAICLDASFNDDPRYYSNNKLWGTRPSLVQLGKKYPW